MRHNIGLLLFLCCISLSGAAQNGQIQDAHSRLLSNIKNGKIDSALISAINFYTASNSQEFNTEQLNASLDSLWSSYLNSNLYPNLVAYKIVHVQERVKKLNQILTRGGEKLPKVNTYLADLAYLNAYTSFLKGSTSLAIKELLRCIELAGINSYNYHVANTLLAKIHQTDKNFYKEELSLKESNRYIINQDSTVLHFNSRSPYLYYYLVNLSQLGEAATNQNKDEQAQAYLNRVVQGYSQLSSNPYFDQHPSYRQIKARTYQRLMKLFYQKNMLDSGNYYFNKAVEYYTTNQPELPELYVVQAEELVKRNNLSEAEKYLLKSLRLFSSILGDASPDGVEVLLKLAEIELEQNRVDSAKSLLSEAKQRFSNLPQAKGKDIRSLILEKEIYSIQARTIAYSNKAWADSAIDLYKKSIQIDQDIRSSYNSMLSKEIYSSRNSKLYEKAINACLSFFETTKDPKYIAQIFQFIEMGKSHILREAVQQVKSKSYNGIPLKLVQAEDSLQELIFYYQASLLNNLVQSQRNALQEKLYNTNNYFEEVREKIAGFYPRYYQFKYDLSVQSLETIQKEVLNPKTALIEYFVGEETIYAFVATRTSANIIQLEKGNLEEEVQDYLTGIQLHKDKIQLSELGYTLYQKIVKPVLEDLAPSVNKLIIIPDGELGYLPFHALPTEDISGNTITAEIPYLFAKYATRREYSATLILEKAKARELTEEPEYAYAGFAPSYTKNLSLPHNKAEVGFLQKLFGGKPYLDGEASEKNFRLYAPKSRIIHYAGHAQASQQAELSGFQFPEPAQPDSVNDGYLYLSELYGLSLKADLAILSACETGVGKLTKGEGIISLARAFHYAGCPNVTMTLWKVNDKATATLVELFSKNLDEGLAKDEALQQARKAFYLQEPVLNHPYYWAGLVLVGDDEPLSSNQTFWWLWIGGGLLVGLVGLYFLLNMGKGGKESVNAKAEIRV